MTKQSVYDKNGNYLGELYVTQPKTEAVDPSTQQIISSDISKKEEVCQFIEEIEAEEKEKEDTQKAINGLKTLLMILFGLFILWSFLDGTIPNILKSIGATFLAIIVGIMFIKASERSIGDTMSTEPFWSSAILTGNQTIASP